MDVHVLDRWDRGWRWVCRHWKAVVTTVAGIVMGVVMAVLVRRKVRTAVAEAVTTAGDPQAALKPLADIGPSLTEIERVERAAAAVDAERAREAHDAIDAADSIRDVNAVLYGVDKPSRAPAAPATGGAPPAGRH